MCEFHLLNITFNIKFGSVFLREFNSCLEKKQKTKSIKSSFDISERIGNANIDCLSASYLSYLVNIDKRDLPGNGIYCSYKTYGTVIKTKSIS